MMKTRKSKGFTIVEVLFVIVISMVFIAISIPFYESYIESTHRKEAQQSLMELSTRMHKVKNKTFSFSNAVSGNKPLAAVYDDKISYNGTTIYNILTFGVTANSFTLYAIPTGKMSGSGNLRLTYINNDMSGTWDSLKNGTYNTKWY